MEEWSGADLYANGPDGPIYGRQFDSYQAGGAIGFEPACDLFLSAAIPGDPAILTDEGTPAFLYGWGDNPGRAFSYRVLYGDKFPLGWGTWNVVGFSDPGYDQVCQSALLALPGQPEHSAFHQLAQEIFAQQLPVIPLYARLDVAVTRVDFCGFDMVSAGSDMWNVEEFGYGFLCASP